MVTLMVGTTKGLFLIEGGGDRTEWSVSGPHCELWPINHAAGDPETGAIWAAGGGDWEGAGIWRSMDGGATWEVSQLSNGQREEFLRNEPDVAASFGWEPSPPAPYTGEVASVWSVARIGDRLYAGTKPAQFFTSGDDGKTWERLDALHTHPSAESWSPGAAGLTLHTIVSDPGHPEKLWIAISAAGVFASEDGGRTWERRNRLSNAEACEHHDHPASARNGETGHCVHNMMRTGGDVLYQQNHHGVWRSDDGGRSWHDITEGLPSTFGFPIRVHPRDPDTVWVFPLNGDSTGRYPPEASAAVWKSSDGGRTWDAKRAGLPQGACFFTVLRQAMAGDSRDPAGVYFGTNSGSVFASRDEGESWEEIARHLPTVLCVEVLERPRAG